MDEAEARFTIVVGAGQDGLRLDRALAEAAVAAGHEGLSRARFQALLRQEAVTCAGAVVDDQSRRVREGECYAIRLPPTVPSALRAEAIPLAVVYEDDDILVIDKPAGLVVHPGAGNREGTLVQALLAHCGDRLSGIGGVARPGIVHRLDKETSGLLVVAKNDAAHQGLAAQFADRRISRTYQALVWGVPQPLEGQIEGAIGRHPRARQKMAVVTGGGKPALTYYKTDKVFAPLASLVECRLATGRTHQIRVHFAHIGHPLVGDPVYGRRRLGAGLRRQGGGIVAVLEAFPRQALHAGQLKLVHPRSKKTMVFRAALPADFAALLDAIAKPT
jgi:23S rRNA pseudouridine1911/1915/1917 synthase